MAINDFAYAALVDTQAGRCFVLHQPFVYNQFAY